MPNLTNFFAWISPRKKHNERVAKPLASPDKLKAPAIAAAVRRARAQALAPQVAQTNGASKLQAATRTVHRSVRTSEGIPWQDQPPSSPIVVESIEEGLATAAIYDSDEVEDDGDEGAVDELSEEDDSGLMDIDDEEEEDDDGEEEESDEEVSSEADVDSSEMMRSDGVDGANARAEEDDEPHELEDDDQADDIHDANQSTKLVNLDEDHEAALLVATQQFELDRDTKLREQRAEAEEMIREGWHRDTVDLYMLIDRRTMEQLMPLHWDMDFPLFPWSIFASVYEDAFLGGTRPDNDYIMIRATRELLKLPVHVRNQIRIKAWHGRRAEAMVVKYCEDYQKMIHKDAKLYVPMRKKKLWSLIVYAPGDERSNVADLEELVLKRLRKRTEKVLDLLRVDGTLSIPWAHAGAKLFRHDGVSYACEPATLYGILAKEAVIALVAYEPLSGRDKLRTIAFFHMSKPNYDVWNALALAVLMVYCRDHLIKIKEALRAVKGEDLDDLVLSDYDEDA